MSARGKAVPKKSAGPLEGADLVRAVEELSQEAARAQTERRAARAAATASEWKTLAQSYLKQLELTQSRLDTLLAIREDQLVGLVTIPPKRGGGGESVACMVASDWHVEEEVPPASVNGRNTYNLEVAEHRLHNLWRNTVKLLDGARSNTRIDRLVVFLLGDLYSGHIHEELRETTALSPVNSILWLKPRIVGGINYLLQHVEQVEIVAKIGNHSRITFKQHLSNPEAHSLEWLLYHWLAEHFNGEKRVKFHLTPSYHTFVDVLGVKVRAHHGDAFRYAGGIGGLAVPMQVAISRWNRAEAADLDVMGHWHSYDSSTGVGIVNGSLIGYSALSVRFRSAFEPPQQAFFVVSGKHRRVTLRAPIFVE